MQYQRNPPLTYGGELDFGPHRQCQFCGDLVPVRRPCPCRDARYIEIEPQPVHLEEAR